MISRNAVMSPYHFLTSHYGRVAAGVGGVIVAQLLLIAVKVGSEARQKYLDAQRETVSWTLRF